MTRVQVRCAIEAQRVTVDNIDAVADWIGGHVCGIRLPIECRVVQFTNHDQAEQEAAVGEWIVRLQSAEGRRRGLVLAPDEFEDMFA